MKIKNTRKVTAIINGVRAERGGRTYFNDKLKCGARSIKVYGWDRGDYNIAACRLEAAGFKVEFVETHGNNCTPGMFRNPATRLHVTV